MGTFEYPFFYALNLGFNKMANKQQCVLMAMIPNSDYSGMNYQLKELAKNIFTPDGTDVDVVKVGYEHDIQDILKFADEKLQGAYLALTSDVISPHFVDVYHALYNALHGQVRPYLYVGDIGKAFHITEFNTDPVQLDLTEEDLSTTIVNRFVRTTEQSIWSTIKMCVPSAVNLTIPKDFIDLTDDEFRNIVNVYRVFLGTVTFKDATISDKDLLQMAMDKQKK